MKIIIIAILVFLPLTLTAQWDILNEGFKGGINTIDFVNEDVGWIGGWNGTLLKTTDGGENWINIPIDETWDISQIDFINESVGWAIGGAYIDPNWISYIWQTSDGGNTWVQQFSSTIFDFNSIYTIDVTNVFAVGENKIYKTTNGGTNWVDISPNLPGTRYNSVWFQNPQIGVVVGSYYGGTADRGIILRTTNGGISWVETIVNEFEYIFDLQFLDNTTGYFLAYLNTNIFLCKTEDMCRTWTINSFGITSYQFLNKDTGYAVLSDSSVMKTIDGGANWLYIQSFKWGKSKIYFYNSKTGFLLNDNILSQSTDSGYTWETKNFSHPFSNISFINNEKGFISYTVPGRAHYPFYNIFSTTNGGITWNIGKLLMGALESIAFLNDVTGFYILSFGDAGIYKSSNGGKDWFPVNNYLRGYEIFFLNEEIGWAVGYAILVTTDGGSSWDLEWTSEDSSSLYSGCSCGTSGWAVGEKGMIVKYTQQTGWVKQTSVTDLPLNKVSFSDDNHGWIAGGYQNNNGFQKILIKTTDGGSNWDSVPNVPYLIRDFAFIDNNRGWAIGYTETGEGGILETIDGGITWNIDTGNLPAQLNSLFIKDNYGWAVGDNGLILRTTDAGAVWVEDEKNTYPTEFLLEQNYPNPFNPSTSIQYEISSRQFVALKVYDVLGREVAILVNEEKPQGIYEIEFDSKALSSGIYFYQLKAGSYVAIKKMILLK